jgi:hypothetical protein
MQTSSGAYVHLLSAYCWACNDFQEEHILRLVPRADCVGLWVMESNCLSSATGHT